MKTKDKLKRQKQREAKASLKLQSTQFPDLKPQQFKKKKINYSKRNKDGLTTNYDQWKQKHISKKRFPGSLMPGKK